MLNREAMVARMLGADPKADGVFIVAVRTTGIYCLPSCRPSRKPKPENVIFFATPDEAREAGFRACKLCKPDDFYNGHHADETLIEGLVAGIARDPGAYRSTAALANAIGVGASKLHELVRAHYHTTPAALLQHARVAAARVALLTGSRQVAEIAFTVGFESLSAFNENFRKYNGMAPLDYRHLRERGDFVLTLPQNYPVGRILRYLGRDSRSVTERVTGLEYTTVLRVGDGDCPAENGDIPVTVSFAPGMAHCRLVGACATDPAVRAWVHDQLFRILGLTTDPARFEAQIGGTAELAPLIADPFDALVWAITGQQITLAFAFTLRRRLIERIGAPTHAGLHAPPTAAAIAALEPGDLVALGFSRAKADYLVGAARAVVAGDLPLAALADKSATQIERALLATRGIGPWSAHYLLMRHHGFLDCVPVGDAVLNASLQRFFALAVRPAKRETLLLMERFSPYRSLATFHFWQRQGTAA